MLATAAFVLPADVLVVPVAGLAPELSRLGQAECGDFAVTRPRGRTPSCVVDKRFAAFISEFRTPRTIAAAIVDYARARQIDSVALLDAALPLLARLVDAGFLVAADSPARANRSPLRAGQTIGPFRVMSVMSIMNDTEVYAVTCPAGDIAALKLIVETAATGASHRLEHEAAILERLDGRFNPRLRSLGVVDELPCLLLHWCAGEPVVAAAERIRSVAGLSGARTLAVRVLEAFAHLHAQGVIHGDVHPGNVLCARETSTAIVDYGLAVAEGLPKPAGPRGGAGFFFEPEFIGSRGTATATAYGEQYALAALIFMLFTGETYLEFSLDGETAFQQILTQAPRAFAACGSPAWPAVEAILARALEKDPQARFDSLTAFAHALARAPLPAVASNRGRLPDLRRYAQSAMESVGSGSPFIRNGLPEAPTVSVTFGAAGIALACLRMACAADDPALFALAELWTERAGNAAAGHAAFHCERLGITSATVGAISPYHTATGLHAVTLLVAAAGGDLARADRALRAFIAAGTAQCETLDVMLGTCGVLVAAAALLDAIPLGSANRERLLALGDSIARDVWTRLAGIGEIGAATEMTTLGVAHGWAGVLYAGLSWSLATGHPLPAAARGRLEELAAQRVPWASGARWPIGCRVDDRGRFATSWCNGSAGHVFTWTTAYATLGDDRFLERAEDAAWNVWEGSRASGNLCCGDAGAAYALLNVYRFSGDARWRARAERLAYRAIDVGDADDAHHALHRQSLYKGRLGIAVLTADLAEPQRARLPLFERDADAGRRPVPPSASTLV